MVMLPQHALEERPQTARPGRRLVTDPATGRTWQIWEADTARIPGARSARCLIFDAQDVIRRVWLVPDDWRAMTDEGLLRLMCGR
jgi:hypothetical protein